MSGDGPISQGALFQQGDGGANPTSPLHPKQLTVKVISRQEARKLWLYHHYLKRDVPGASLELGVFSPESELVGGLCFSAWVVWAPAGGRPDAWELRRMWLDDRCQKNCESRILNISIRHFICKLAPHVKRVIAYADPEQGHKGTIYKAAGWRDEGWREPSSKDGYGSTKIKSETRKRKFVCELYLKFR
jgi:hypothetical protein